MAAPYLRPAGDLNPAEARAAVAAIVGPQRIPFGSQRTFAINIGAQVVSVEAAAHGSSSSNPLYVEIRQLTGALNAYLVGPSPNLAPGFNSTILPTALNQPFSFLLYPGERLFIQEPGGAGSTILVSAVTV